MGRILTTFQSRAEQFIDEKQIDRICVVTSTGYTFWKDQDMWLGYLDEISRLYETGDFSRRSQGASPRSFQRLLLPSCRERYRLNSGSPRFAVWAIVMHDD